MKINVYFLVSFLLVFIDGRTQSNTTSPILFSVNKKPVSVEEFNYLYKKNHTGKPGEFTKEKIEEYLRLYIRFKLKVEEARQRGMDTTSRFKKEFAGYKEALRKPYLPDTKLIDSLTLVTYNRLKEEVKAAHILVKVAADASPADTMNAYTKILAIKKRVEAGEDFGSLAVRESEDPSAKSNEGNLGYFTAMQMVYPFESQAFNTPVGQVSNPVRTRFGYHLIKVSDRRPALGEVEVSHILIRIGKDRDNERAKKQVFDVYDRLEGGVKWEDLCRQYSEDQSSKDNGGKLRPFGVGAMASVPDFERVAFSLSTPGEYSSPFATQYGWHIVRLEKKIPLPSFKEMETSLKSRVSRDERMQTAKQSIQKNLRAKYLFTENTDTKKQVIALADTSLQQAKWKKPTGIVANQTLFALGTKSISAGECFDYIVANQKPNKQAPTSYLNQLYENFVNARIEAAVEEDLMRTNADYRYLSNEYYEGILLFDIMEKEVWNRASEDSIGQRNYFDSHPGKYKAGERADVRIYSAPNADALRNIELLVKQDSLVSQDLLKKSGIRFERGKFEKAERAVLSSIPWTPGIQSVELDGNYYLVKIERILPAGDRSFEEARGQLISDYQNYLEEEWLTLLQKKYTVKINNKGKKYALGKLISTN